MRASFHEQACPRKYVVFSVGQATVMSGNASVALPIEQNAQRRNTPSITSEEGYRGRFSMLSGMGEEAFVGAPLLVGLDGELDARFKVEIVETVNGHCLDFAQSANQLEAALKEDEWDWPHMIRCLDQMLVGGARIASTIRPTRSGKGSVKPVRRARQQFLEGLFDDPAAEPVHNRAVRHRLEHYDEYLEEAVESQPGAGLVTLYGPPSLVEVVGGPAPIYRRAFDPHSGTYTILNESVDVRALVCAVQTIHLISHRWLARADPLRHPLDQRAGPGTGDSRPT